MNIQYTFNQKKTDSQNYYFFKDGFTKEELLKIEKDVASIPFQDATTGGNSEQNKESRSSKIKWLPQDTQWYWLYEKLCNLAVEANDILWNFDLYSLPEYIQYTEYPASEGGHYHWHQDIGPDMLSLRKVSITVQLSEDSDYEGGELEFNAGADQSLPAPRGAGTVVIFPSYMMHRVTKVTKGTRKSFVLWVGGAHYK
jgi:PKHD-type hydroxylase